MFKNFLEKPFENKTDCGREQKEFRQSNAAKQQRVSFAHNGLHKLSQIALINERTSEVENGAEKNYKKIF